MEDLNADGGHNIKMDLKEIGWENVDLVHLVQVGISGGLL
jgi:hypothetical protein